jgi:hypothetical protein
MYKVWNRVDYEKAGKEAGYVVIPFHIALLGKYLLSAA